MTHCTVPKLLLNLLKNLWIDSDERPARNYKKGWLDIHLFIQPKGPWCAHACTWCFLILNIKTQDLRYNLGKTVTPSGIISHLLTQHIPTKNPRIKCLPMRYSIKWINLQAKLRIRLLVRGSQRKKPGAPFYKGVTLYQTGPRADRASQGFACPIRHKRRIVDSCQSIIGQYSVIQH